MDLVTAKKFFAQILDLKYTKSKDRATFRKIMKLVDVEGNRVALKENVLNFFTLPDFLSVIVRQEQTE